MSWIYGLRSWAGWLILGSYWVHSAVAQQIQVPTFGTTVVISSGLCGQIYEIPADTIWLPRFSKLKPVGTIYTTVLNVPPRNFNEGFPGVTQRSEWFAIDYAGKFWIQKPGKYRFALNSDDGSKLYIDDHLVIDNDGMHPAVTETGKRKLSLGIHRIRVSYFQGPRFQVALTLAVAPPGETWRIFNTDDFKPPPDSEIWNTPQPGRKRGK